MMMTSAQCRECHILVAPRTLAPLTGTDPTLQRSSTIAGPSAHAQPRQPSHPSPGPYSQAMGSLPLRAALETPAGSRCARRSSPGYWEGSSPRRKS